MSEELYNIEDIVVQIERVPLKIGHFIQESLEITATVLASSVRKLKFSKK